MRLSETKGFEQSRKKATALLEPIITMQKNPKVRELREKGISFYGYICAMIDNEPDATAKAFAIINDRDEKEFRENCTTTDITNTISEIITDDDLAVLFGLREKKTEKTSTSSRSGTTGAKKK